jgi:nitrite reductase/ring-hydroxylating ferredoxin subunit
MTRRHEVSAERLPAPGARTLLRVDGECVVLFNLQGEYHALADSCPHQGASLAGGKLEGRSVQCPAHGLRFDIVTGCMLQAPGMRATIYPVAVEHGRVFLQLP